MSIKKIVLGVCLILIANFAYAGIIKGGLGPGRIRAISLTTGDSTFLPVIVMNDNFASDFDIFIIRVDVDEVICSSTSTFRQIEKMECGLEPSTDYDILVQNVLGPASPFRLYIGDEISVTSAKPGRLSQRYGSDELSLQDLPSKVRDQIKKISSRK